MKKSFNKQELFKDLSKGQIRYRPRSKTPVRTLVKSVDKESRNTNTSSLFKYQSYLKFIQEDKLTHRKRLSFSKEQSNPIFINLSKTPNLNRQFAPYLDRGRRSLAQKRRSPVKQILSLIQTPKNIQQHKIPRKLSTNKEKKNKKTKNKETDNTKSRLEIDEEIAQKTLFDGIQFFRDLGKGAHALVRSAVDWKQNRKVAVKIYNKASLDSQEKISIQRQIDILQSIVHPNIAVLYDVIETPKTINLMMEYGGGNSLYQHIRSRNNGLFSQEQAKPLFKQIFQAISYLHSKNIVHRDIKPQNILLNKALHVKLIDFGFSLVSKTSQKVDTFCGTPTYMAPQIVNKKKHVGLYADRWSLGVLLYTVLQGIYPFRASNQKDLFTKISRGQFEFIILLSDQVTKLIRSFLRMKPQQRLSPQQGLKSPWFQNNNEYKKVIDDKTE